MTQHVWTMWTSSSSSSVSNNLLHVPSIPSEAIYNTRRPSPIYIHTALVLEVYTLTYQLCTLGQGCGLFSRLLYEHLYRCMETHVTYGFMDANMDTDADMDMDADVAIYERRHSLMVAPAQLSKSAVFSSLIDSICNGPPEKPGIFVKSIQTESLAMELGLEVGDQILWCNDTDCHSISHSQVMCTHS